MHKNKINTSLFKYCIVIDVIFAITYIETKLKLKQVMKRMSYVTNCMQKSRYIINDTIGTLYTIGYRRSRDCL